MPTTLPTNSVMPSMTPIVPPMTASAPEPKLTSESRRRTSLG
jgi:hypothetical protein